MKNIVKATTDARVRFCYQSNFLTEHQYFDYKFKTQTSKSWPNLASVSRQRLDIITTTKHRQQNTDQTSVSKSRRSFNLKILTKLCAQNQTKNLTLWPNFSFQICTKLSSTHFSASTSATVTTSTSFELASSHFRVTSIKSTKQESVSHCIALSQLVTRVASDRTRVR